MAKTKSQKLESKWLQILLSLADQELRGTAIKGQASFLRRYPERPGGACAEEVPRMEELVHLAP
jgi:hypothetical protein